MIYWVFFLHYKSFSDLPVYVIVNLEAFYKNQAFYVILHPRAFVIGMPSCCHENGGGCNFATLLPKSQWVTLEFGMFLDKFYSVSSSFAYGIEPKELGKREKR